jgi:pre-mRNA-splicing factor SYF1
MELCKVISKHPNSVKSINCENVIRHGIKKYTDEVGNLYVALADYFIKQGLFEKARDIFEEALENVSIKKVLTLRF